MIKVKKIMFVFTAIMCVSLILVPRNALAQTNNEITYYNQSDYRSCPFNGSNVSASGCGITAFAMVASLYDVDITPEDVAELSNKHGSVYNTVVNHDAINNLAEYYDMPALEEMGGILRNCCKEADYNEKYLKEKLEEGCVMIVSQTGGHFNPSYKGHYTVLYGMGENGPIVYDPGSRERTEESENGYDWDSIFENVKHIWIFPKQGSDKSATELRSLRNASEAVA